MRRTLTVLTLAVAFGFGLAGGPASAAPITCPPPQVAAHDGDGWHCQNNGGNDSGADETKNPND